MSVPLEQVAESLLRANLLTETELELACSELSGSGEAVTSDRLLVHLANRGRLTEYQRQRVGEGRSGELVLGNYTVLNRLGEGGMGEVYKAIHRRMRRVVAIKVIRKKLATKQFVERFRREIQAAARLTHPNAISAYDADECELGDFLVMEYVEGADLRRIVEKTGPLSVKDAIDAVRQAARALAYAHQHGLVHRDVKPANLMRDLTGCIKVADLGLARLAEEDDDPMQETSITAEGLMAGTIDYMAPEQGVDADGVDGRADIYSLGCTLFYLLTGRPVFETKAPVKRLLAHRIDPPPKLHQVNPQASPELDAIFQRAVAKQPDQRYATMDQLIDALDQCEHRRPAPAQSPAQSWATRAVIVEPSRLQAAMISKLLNELNITDITNCTSAAEAIEALTFVPADIVLVSLQLADTSGLQLAERIRDELRWSRVAILIMTSDHVAPSFQEAITRLGLVALIRKPFGSAALRDAISKLQNAAPAKPAPLTGLAARRVLIVDDSSIARKSIQKTLTELGFEHFTIADDGRPAVEAMSQENFDLVITDYTMPEMNGRDFVAWIRQNSRQKDIPVVMVTTEYEPAKLAEIYELGVSAICAKSFDMESVRNIIFRLFA